MGAEEGIYTLNLNELHENAMDLLYPRRTTWMFVIKDVLMTISGQPRCNFETYLLAEGFSLLDLNKIKYSYLILKAIVTLRQLSQ